MEVKILKAMFKKREDKSPRTHFGEAGKAWIKIEISEDARRVFLREALLRGRRLARSQPHREGPGGQFPNCCGHR